MSASRGIINTVPLGGGVFMRSRMRPGRGIVHRWLSGERRVGWSFYYDVSTPIIFYVGRRIDIILLIIANRAIR